MREITFQNAEELTEEGIPFLILFHETSDTASVKGRPPPFTLKITGLRLSAGAGFVVALGGSIVTMPGLPREPQAWHIDIERGVDGRRRVIGLK